MYKRQILDAPIDELERFRTHRLTPVLTHDIGMVSGLCLSLPMTVVAATIVLGCLGWLVWLSWQLAALLAVVMRRSGQARPAAADALP